MDFKFYSENNGLRRGILRVLGFKVVNVGYMCCDRGRRRGLGW